jgi:hypothetical protein
LAGSFCSETDAASSGKADGASPWYLASLELAHPETVRTVKSPRIVNLVIADLKFVFTNFPLYKIGQIPQPQRKTTSDGSYNAGDGAIVFESIGT